MADHHSAGGELVHGDEIYSLLTSQQANIVVNNLSSLVPRLLIKKTKTKQIKTKKSTMVSTVCACAAVTVNFHKIVHFM